MPKNQNTAAKKARAIQRTSGGKYTVLLAEQTCGKGLDPFGVYEGTCARPAHHETEPCSDRRDFDAEAWKKRATAEREAAEARWNALTPDQRAEQEWRVFEDEYDDGRTVSDDWEDARSYKWED